MALASHRPSPLMRDDLLTSARQPCSPVLCDRECAVPGAGEGADRKVRKCALPSTSLLTLPTRLLSRLLRRLWRVGTLDTSLLSCQSTCHSSDH